MAAAEVVTRVAGVVREVVGVVAGVVAEGEGSQEGVVGVAAGEGVVVAEEGGGVEGGASDTQRVWL